MNSSFY